MEDINLYHMQAEGLYKNGELISQPFLPSSAEMAATQANTTGIQEDQPNNAAKVHCETCPPPGLTHGHSEPCAHSCHGTNSIGIPRDRLNRSPGRPRGARNLHAKHPSSIAKAFKKAGLDWQQDFALAIKNNRRERIRLWLRLLPYLITQRNHATTVKRWKGKASKAALIALGALEGKE